MADPVCVGSGLIALDVIYRDRSAKPNFLAGGSCGNVLAILSYLGWDSYPIARLGDDVEGRRIIEDMKKWGVKTKFIQQEPGIDSPRIIERVFAGAKPHHKFHFKCEHGNWLPGRKPFLLKSLELIQDKIPAADVMYFDRATPSAYELARRLKQGNTIIVFEPPKLLDDPVFMRCLGIADVVKHCYKAQDEESEISIPLEIQTKSEDGLRYRTNFLRSGKWRSLPSFPAYDPADAAGSGDWLTAGLIHRMRRHRTIQSMSRKQLEDALDFGQALASINCSYVGARGMMYCLPKERIIRLAGRHMRGKRLELIRVRTTRTKSRLAEKCRVCLCTSSIS